jgi:hypothetical protein
VSDLRKAAGAYPVYAVFVFLDLLERYSDLVGKFSLPKVSLLSKRSDPFAHCYISLIRPFASHFDVLPDHHSD